MLYSPVAFILSVVMASMVVLAGLAWLILHYRRKALKVQRTREIYLTQEAQRYYKPELDCDESERPRPYPKDKPRQEDRHPHVCYELNAGPRSPIEVP
ncbi:hypothetical protein F5Y15DRAFT_385784 [Xylariaceae sp. FL0016]|nr:hypothetical protein F5Y15DRAFT_385784 [Xylariaceae sp. FL0016]